MEKQSNDTASTSKASAEPSRTPSAEVTSNNQSSEQPVESPQLREEVDEQSADHSEKNTISNKETTPKSNDDSNLEYQSDVDVQEEPDAVEDQPSEHYNHENHEELSEAVPVSVETPESVDLESESKNDPNQSTSYVEGFRNDLNLEQEADDHRAEIVSAGSDEEASHIEPSHIEEPSQPFHEESGNREPIAPAAPQDNDEPMLDVPSQDVASPAPDEDTTFSENKAGQASNDEDDVVAAASFYHTSVDLLQSMDRSLFNVLLVRFNEYEALQSSKDVSKIQAEQVVHSAKTKIENLRSELKARDQQIKSFESQSKQVSENKQKYQGELESIKTELEKSKQYAATLTSKLDQYSKDKATAYELVTNKQEQLSELTKEIDSINENTKSLRSKIRDGEISKRDAESKVTSITLEKTKIERELNLAKQSAQWYESELTKRNQQLQDVRSSTHNEIVSLKQRAARAEQKSAVDSGSNASLQSSLRDLQSKYDLSVAEIKKLEDKNSQQEHDYSEELSKKEQLLTVLQNSNDERKRRIESLEKTYKEASIKVKQDESDYKAQFEKLQNIIADKDAKIKELDKTVDDLSTTNTSVNAKVFGALTSSDGENAVFNPSVSKLLKSSKYSLTDIITRLSELQKSLVQEKRAKQKAEDQLQVIFKELDRRMPLIKSYKEKCASMEMKQGQLGVILDNMTKEKSMLQTQLKISSKKSDELQLQVTQLTRYKYDLQTQLAVLLAEVTTGHQSGSLVTTEEKKYIADLLSHSVPVKDTSDTDHLITERLTTFKDITDLIEKNEKLLIVSRRMGNELESGQVQSVAEVDQREKEALTKSAKAIEKLQDELESTKAQFKAAANSRDMLQKLVESGVTLTSSGNSSDVKALKESVDSLTNEVESQKRGYESLKKQYDTKVFELNEKIRSISKEKSQVTLDLAKANSSIKLAQEKANSSAYQLSSASAENSKLNELVQGLQARQATLESRSQQLSDNLLNAKSEEASMEVELKTLRAAKEMWQTSDGKLREQLETLSEEKSQANALIVKLQSLDTERESQYKSNLEKLKGDAQALQKQVDSLQSKLSTNTEEMKSILYSKNADARSYQERIDLLTSELASVKKSLQERISSVEVLNKNLDSLKKKYESLTTKRVAALSSLTTDGTSDDVTAALRQELNNALEDSKIASQNAIQYKQIASTSEKELNSLNEAYSTYKETAEAQLANGKKEVEELSAKVNSITAAKADLENQLQAATQNYEEESARTKSKIEELSSTIGSFDQIKKDYEDRISTLQSNLEKSQESGDNLHDELQKQQVASRNSEQKASELQDHINELDTQISSLTSQLKASQASLQTAKEAWQEKEAQFDSEIRRSKMRISELDTQYRTVMNQLESSQMTFNDSGDEDINKLLGYLHRQNDSLSQQLDYSRSEEKALRKSVDSAEQEVKELKSQLVETTEKANVSEKYYDLLKKMKKDSMELNVFKENNEALRKQVATYSQKTQNLVQSSQSVNNTLEDLRKRIAQLQGRVEFKDKQLKASQLELQKINTKYATEVAKAKEGSEQSATTAEAIKKMTAEKQQLIKKISELEKSQNANKSKEQSKLYQAEMARLNGVIAGLRQRVTSLKDELAKKVEEVKKIADDAKASAGSNGSTNKARDEFKKKVRASELENYKKKLEKEKEEFKNQLTAETEAFKKKLKNESDVRMNEEISAYKKRIRAPSNARISEVIEQRWRARSAELESRYQAKLKELDEKMKSVGSNTTDLEKQEINLTKERKQIRDEVTAAVKKETEFRENILKRQLGSLREQVKKLSSSSPTPNQASIPTGPSSELPSKPIKRVAQPEAKDVKRSRNN